MAYKYDPILRMNVPDRANDAKKWIVEYDDALGDYHKRVFVDKDAVEKFIRRGTDVGRAYNLKVNGKLVKNESTWTADEKTWDHAIQAADASRIIEQKNGYTLGINSQGTICLAFPGETIDNPHMYLGKENEKNLADAKAMFKEFSSLRGK